MPNPSLKPTIVTLLDTPAVGGAEQYMWDILSMVAEKGHPVVVATNNSQVKKLYLQKCRKRNYSNFSVATAPYLLDAIGNWKGLLKYIAALPTSLYWFYTFIKKLPPNSIFLFPGFSDRLTFSPLIKLLSFKLVWIEIGPLAPTFKKNWGFPRWLYFATKNLPDRFLTTSKWTFASMLTEGLIPSELISLAYPSIQPLYPRQLNHLKLTGRQLRSKYIGNTEHMICFVGRLATENEVDLLIKAFSILPEDLKKKSKVVIIGDGPDRQRLEKIAHRLKVSTKVVFTGYLTESEKLALLSATDAFVFTRAWDLDGFGMTTIEAMSVKVPAITNSYGPQREIVKDGVTGFVFQPHNYRHLAQVLRAILPNRALNKKVATAGYAFVIKTFNHQNLFSVIEKTLTELS